ncbi:MAG: ABC transporter permease [Spirochaetales bacterium]|nr:ABC transporter permease [Spirochaetales bacterium]
MNSFVLQWSRKRIFKRGRLTSCLILIALVMAPLVCALIFSDSMMEGITSKYIYLSDGHIQLNYNGRNELAEFDASQYPDMIYSADEVVTGYALMYSATGTGNVIVKGIGEDYFNENRLDQITFLAEYGSKSVESSNLRGISISRSTARKLNVEIGDNVALMIVPDNPDKVLRPILCRIDNIFYSGYDQLDSLLCFMNREDARSLYSERSSASVEVLVNGSYMEKLDEVAQTLGSGYEISLWNEYNVSVYENFVTSRQMIFIILLLVVVVAAFYTASVAQQMVQDDITDIAISKLIGCSDSLVKKSAFLSVYAVTVIGMLIGILFGLLIGCNLGPILTSLSRMGLQSLSFYLLDFDITVPWIPILIISACLLVISYVAIRLSLARTRRISPIQLFTTL